LKNTFVIGILIIVGACGSVKFQKQTLYDRYEKPLPKKQGAQTIFEDALGTMWHELAECGEFSLTNEIQPHSGKSCIKIIWDRGKGCTWAGFGNSYNNWAPVDLSQDRFKKALSFYVKSTSKPVKSIPIVANLEDFGGGGSYYFVDAKKYLNGLEIDSIWRQIVVPLWDFPVNEEEVDIYSIKQVKFQLEGTGSFYLDDIEIIDYSKKEYQQMRDAVELMKPKGKANQSIYPGRSLKEDIWGYENNNCQILEERQEENNPHIYWNFKPDCNWSKWGINWNNWYQVNFRGITATSKIIFKVKTSPGAVFNIKLEDFHGHSTIIYTHEEASSWKLIKISLAELDLKGKKFKLDQIKQLLFEGLEPGEVFIDSIKIVE